MKKLTTFLLFIIVSIISNAQNDVLSKYDFSNTLYDEIGIADAKAFKTDFVKDRFGLKKGAIRLRADSLSTVSMGDKTEAFNGSDNKFSISLWLKRVGFGYENPMLLSKYGNSNCKENEREFFLQIYKNKNIEFVFYSELTFRNVRSIVGTTTNINDTLWHHVVVNYDGAIDSNNGLDRVQIYVDNEKQATSLRLNSGPLGDIANSSSHLSLGGALSSNGILCSRTEVESSFIFDGILDDLIIFSDTISSQKVDDLFYDDICKESIVIYETIQDTVLVEVIDTVTVQVEITDTVYLSVDDTLKIPITITSLDKISQTQIKVFPNPANTEISLDFGSINATDNYSYSITNSSGAVVISQNIIDPTESIEINSIGGTGLYFLYIYN